MPRLVFVCLVVDILLYNIFSDNTPVENVLGKTTQS